MASNSPESYSHKPKGFSDALLHQLHRLWLDETFCDVTLSVGGMSFKAHRTMLCAASPYFRAMLMGGLAESGQSTIQLHDITSNVFQILLSFIYTGEIKVEKETCEELLRAADMLSIEHAVQACVVFLQSQLHPSNCIGIFLLSDKFNLCSLRSSSQDYVCNHFSKVYREDEFVRTPSSALLELLDSENLTVDGEHQVLAATLRWIAFDSSSRISLLDELLSRIRLSLISPHHLRRCLSTSQHCGDSALIHLVVRRQASQARIGPPMNPRKGARKSIYMIGGYRREEGGRWSDSEALATVERFDVWNQCWQTCPQMLSPRSGHGSTVLGNLIYVCGGESDSLIYDTVECFNPVLQSWSQLPSMTTPRCGHGFCTYDGKLYALGGWVGAQIGDSIERYDPKEGQWTLEGCMQTLRFQMGVVEDDGFIWVAGGTSDLGCELKRLERYNPFTRQWSRKADMLRPRCCLGIVPWSGHLYVFGGWNEEDGLLASAEKYSIDEDKWTELTPMKRRRAGVCVVVVNGHLYVIGGRVSNRPFTEPPATDGLVECFDTVSETWTEVTKLPTGRSEAVAVVI